MLLHPLNKKNEKISLSPQTKCILLHQIKITSFRINRTRSQGLSESIKDGFFVLQRNGMFLHAWNKRIDKLKPDVSCRELLRMSYLDSEWALPRNLESRDDEEPRKTKLEENKTWSLEMETLDDVLP
jgi:hypothetical protein